jgi:uncharacterized membrane protein YraQ (UPF0718 family)
MFRRTGAHRAMLVAMLSTLLVPVCRCAARRPDLAVP